MVLSLMGCPTLFIQVKPVKRKSRSVVRGPDWRMSFVSRWTSFGGEDQAWNPAVIEADVVELRSEPADVTVRTTHLPNAMEPGRSRAPRTGG